MKPQSRTLAAPASAGRRLLLLLVLLAFAAQSYLTQTHIHSPAAPAASLAAAGHTKTPDRPAPSDPYSDCAICQQMIHAGVAITPTGPLFFLALDWTHLVLTALPLPAARQAPGTGWQSRAPPQH